MRAKVKKEDREYQLNQDRLEKERNKKHETLFGADWDSFKI